MFIMLKKFYKWAEHRLAPTSQSQQSMEWKHTDSPVKKKKLVCKEGYADSVQELERTYHLLLGISDFLCKWSMQVKIAQMMVFRNAPAL